MKSKQCALALSLVLSSLAGGCGNKTAMTLKNSDMAMGKADPCAHCGAPYVCCGGKCLDPKMDPLNCGACGKTCHTGEVCTGGSCSCAGELCGTRTCCVSSGGCVDTTSDIKNCGGCGTACSDGQTCTNSTCTDAPGCMGCNGSCCGGQCSDTTMDKNNCGACGTQCTQNQACINGVCVDGQNPPPSDAGVDCSCSHPCKVLQCVLGCCPEDLLTGCKPNLGCVGLKG